MAKQTADPGIGEKFDAPSGRVLNRDGTFNVRRTGFQLGRIHVFQYLIRISWLRFFLLLLGGFSVANIFFALVYLMLGPGALKSADMGSGVSRFWESVFFSVHTMTTVGYGNLYPFGFGANVAAGIEAMTGLLGFSIATGLVYGRFSKPVARLVFSKQVLMVPHTNNTNALMFRVANLRSSVMMDIEARVLLTFVEKIGESYIRKYFPVELERGTVGYLPLSWTLVHPVNEQSPLYGKSAEDCRNMMLELMVTIKGFDETYGANVHSRYSYLPEDIVWGAKFLPSFHTRSNGTSVLYLNKISAHKEAQLHPPTLAPKL